MIIRCAWCKKILGTKPPFGAKYDAEITDGICDNCLNLYFPHHAERVREWMGVEKIEEIYKGGEGGHRENRR